MNPANLITAARIAASPLLFWAILASDDSLGTSWLAFVLGWTFGASDFLDGYLARRFNWISRSGAFLDPLADKIVVLGSMFALVAVDRYWWLPVGLIAIRELGHHSLPDVLGSRGACGAGSEAREVQVLHPRACDRRSRVPAVGDVDRYRRSPLVGIGRIHAVFGCPLSLRWIGGDPHRK